MPYEPWFRVNLAPSLPRSHSRSLPSRPESEAASPAPMRRQASMPARRAGRIPCGSPFSIPQAAVQALSGTLRVAAELGRGQLHLSRVSDCDGAGRMARSHARRLPLQLQSLAAHHPHQPPARLPRDRRPLRRNTRTVRAAGKLGPLLFQLPPNFKADPALLADFLSAPAFAGPTPPMAAFEFRHQAGSPKRPTRSCACTTPRSASPKATTCAPPKFSARAPTPAIACAAAAATASRRSRQFAERSPHSPPIAMSTSTSSTRTSPPAR
jgi:hypothetical protein